MMVFHDINEVNDIISIIPFVDILEKFQQNDFILEGRIRTKGIDGLNTDLEFLVQIYPEYPLKTYEDENIKFINKELIPYNHVMGNGTICIHTLHTPKLKEKLFADFNSLKAWIKKYYISNDKDSHYEHIIISEKPFNNTYFSYQFTNVDYTFTKGEFGQVNLVQLISGVYRGKKIENFIIKSFESSQSKGKVYCNWSDYYLNLKNEYRGLFIFLRDVPAIHNRFSYSNWLDLENLVPDNFLKFLYDISRKHKNTFIPVFFGYKTVDNEIHWISTIVDLKDIPTVSIPILDSKGVKVKGKWKGVLVDKNIDWAITRNSSYKYFFGRGTFCDQINNAKILIIGLGAIGSMVAKTLVKCGAIDLSIADYDVKEPENVCRSEYAFSNGLYDKTLELIQILRENSPFVNVKFHNNNQYFESLLKAFHKNNEVKEEYEKSLNQFDLIFNCSSDSDLMFVLDELNLNTDLINLSITNHAKDLVCAFYPNIYKYVQNQFIYILNNDVKDLYNPTGCWSPTFRASYNDISLLVQYAMKEINTKYKENKPKDNFTLSIDSENNTNIKFTQY